VSDRHTEGWTTVVQPTTSKGEQTASLAGGGLLSLRSLTGLVAKDSTAQRQCRTNQIKSCISVSTGPCVSILNMVRVEHNRINVWRGRVDKKHL